MCSVWVGYRVWRVEDVIWQFRAGLRDLALIERFVQVNSPVSHTQPT